MEKINVKCTDCKCVVGKNKIYTCNKTCDAIMIAECFTSDKLDKYYNLLEISRNIIGEIYKAVMMELYKKE